MRRASTATFCVRSQQLHISFTKQNQMGEINTERICRPHELKIYRKADTHEAEGSAPVQMSLTDIVPFDTISDH